MPSTSLNVSLYTGFVVGRGTISTSLNTVKPCERRARRLNLIKKQGDLQASSWIQSTVNRLFSE